MKIFVMILLGATMASATPDIGLEVGYNHNTVSNAQHLGYYIQQQQSANQQHQPQQNNQNVIENSFLKTNTQFLPQAQGQAQSQNRIQLQPQHSQGYVAPEKQQQQTDQSFIIQYPMPNDFPSTQNFQPIVKSARRYRPRKRIPKKTIVTKNFYIHSAPEETQDEIDEELADLHQQPRKHYNVLFVKTPSQSNKAAALNLARSLKEEKTVVYVLAKKTSAADLQDAVQETPQHHSKPEVFFIKYRTPEEAANAQHQIQSQYDSLGGTTTISDEGYAPTTSVIGSLDTSEDDKEELEEQLQQQQQQQQQLLQPLDNVQEQSQSSSDHYDEQQLVNSPPTSSSHGYLPPTNQY